MTYEDDFMKVEIYISLKFWDADQHTVEKHIHELY